MKLALGLAVAAAAFTAAPAHAAVVAITNSGLRDPQTRIFTGQKVKFTNLTGGVVRIDSTGRPDFADLTLGAGAAGERRYRRTGRYKYTAAGRDGVIIVSAFARPPRSRRNGRCGGRKVYRYDIRVRGSKTVRETWLPQFRNSGAFTISYGYRVNYPNARLVVRNQCGGGRQFDLPSGRVRGRSAPGTGSLTGYSWSDSVQSTDSGRPPPCSFNTDVSDLGAQVTVEGITSRGFGGSVSIASRLTDSQRDVLSALLTEKRAAVCDKDPGSSNSSVFDGLPGYDASAPPIFSSDFNVSGGKLRPPNTALHGFFSAARRRSNPAIARKLARGRSVTVRATRDFEGTSSQTHATGKASISISMRRR